MSTKIRQALIDYSRITGKAEEALAQWERVEQAARDLTRLHLGDYTDDVRRGSKVLSETPNGGNTWDHPDVKAWSDAAQVLEQIAKESE
jgi:hypothetical protein